MARGPGEPQSAPLPAPPLKPKGSSSRGSWSTVVKSLCSCESEGPLPQPLGYVGVLGRGGHGGISQVLSPLGPEAGWEGRQEAGSGREGTACQRSERCQPHPPTGDRKGCRVTCGICGQTNREAGYSPREDRKPASESFGCNKHHALSIYNLSNPDDLFYMVYQHSNPQLYRGDGHSTRGHGSK